MKAKSKARLLYGVGINDADYSIYRHEIIDGKHVKVWACPFYSSWARMLNRCYSKNYQTKFPTYVGCSVAKEWHRFSAFKAWMQGQDWEGKQLDKDILSDGNKVYSQDNCVFVSGELNRFLNTRAASRGKFPIGVCWHKHRGKYLSRCDNPFTGKKDNLGYFDDPEEAHQAWKRRKHELACQYAEMQTDPRIAEALRSRFL